MTTTLTLSPDATTASVLITANTDAAGVTITRTDQNGVAPVRLLAGQQLGQAVAIRDYEAALVGPVRYTCTTTEPVELRRNLARDPFARGSGAAFTEPAGSSTDVSKISGAALGEAEAIRWTVVGSGARRHAIYATFDPSRALGVRVKLLSSRTRTLTVQLRPNVGSSSGARSLPSVNLQAGVPMVYEVGGESPDSASAGSAGVVFVDLNAQAGDTLDATAVLVEMGGLAGPTFDGSTSGAQWLGTPNASPSVIRGVETVERIVRFDEGAHEVAADVWSVVERPQYGARGRVTLSQSLTATDRSTRHDIIGRPDPVFIIQRGGFRTGTVEVLCLDVAAVDAFYQLQGQAGIVQVRTAALSPGQRLVGDLYVKVTGVSSDTVQGSIPWRFRVRLDVAEVRRPTGPLLGAAVWTYAALPMPELGLTYEGLPRLFATYNDLAAGVRIDA